MAADRAAIGRRLAVARRPHRPPLRRRKSAHASIVSPLLGSAAIGVGLSLLAAFALRETRKGGAAQPPPSGGAAEPPLQDDAPQPRVDARLGLRAGEDLQTGIDRMRDEQLIVAIEALNAAPSGSAVHEARKALKRLSTLERLARRDGSRISLGRRDALRCASKTLSEARDAEVAVATLNEVLAHHDELSQSPGIATLRSVLLAEMHAAACRLRESPARQRARLVLEALHGELRQERGEPRQERADPGQERGELRPRPQEQASMALEARVTGTTLEARVIYARGRRGIGRARRHGDVASMHEWRKHVKELRYLAEAMGGAQRHTTVTKRLSALRRRSLRLGEALGEEHDLAMLAERVRRERKLFDKDASSRKALLELIDRRRKRLRRRALRSGRKLYAYKPKQAMRRVGLAKG